MQEKLKQLGIPYRENVLLSQFTGMNLRGMIPTIAYPRTCAQMVALCRYVFANNLSYEILGNVTNTYLCENFSRDIVICTNKLKEVEIKEDGTVTVESGYNLSKLSKQMVDKGYAGFEGLVGIPGTVGAAVINNSGAFGCDMEGVVKECLCLSMNTGNLIVFTNEQLGFTYRNSLLKGKKDFCVLSVTFKQSHSLFLPDESNAILQSNLNSRHNFIDGRRKSLGTVFVSQTMVELYKRHRIALLLWKILNFPNKLLFNRKDLALYLQFLCLGHPELARHCDSIGRFCWDLETSEKDFFHYLDTMKSLSGGKLKLEIEIKE